MEEAAQQGGTVDWTLVVAATTGGVIVVVTTTYTIITFKALSLAKRQLSHMAKDSKARAFADVLSIAREIDLENCLETIRYLPDGVSYKSVTPEQGEKIRRAVEFFNDLSHYYHKGLIDGDTLHERFATRIKTCGDKCMPWVTGFRKGAGERYYTAFETLHQGAINYLNRNTP